MEAKTKASVVFLMCLSVVLLSSVWYGLGFESHTSKIPLSKDQLNTIAKCRESEVNLLDVEFADSNLVCYPTTETKRDIAILSTYPVTGSTLIRSIFESVTGVSTYTQYAESSDYREACNFQDGPWKLYCQKGDNENECLHSHPPPKDIPYIVNTNYPIYSTICESYGYPLPRHEMAIHIVRNPIDSVEAWINYEYGDSIMANWNNNTLEGYLIDYLDWHTYFKNYHENEPDIPTIWIRYEDLHLCPKQTMEAIFSFTKTSSIVNQEKLNNDITYMTAKEPKKVGQAIPFYTKDQFDFVLEEFKFVIHHFGYDKLYEEFITFRSNPTTDKAKTAFAKALWPELDYDSHPSDRYCEELLSIYWDWNNSL